MTGSFPFVQMVFTCFLEWNETPGELADGSVVVDLVHVKKGIGAWELCKTSYQKLGLTRDTIVSIGKTSGFKIIERTESNMVLVVLGKS